MLKKIPTLVWLAGAAFTVGALAAPAQSPSQPAGDSAAAAGATRKPSAPATEPGPDGAYPDQPSGRPSDPAADKGGDEPGGEPSEQATVLQQRQTDLGAVVADGAGRTLYLSDGDDNRPPTTTCYDACAERWIPLTTKGRVLTQGVKPALVGFLKRKDGTVQVTLNGWPLYRYLRDRAPGETKGQGFRNSWSAIGPDGKPAG